MTLHPTTFGYLNPSEEMKAEMNIVRSAAADYADAIQQVLPEGPDKTYTLRKLREVNMWAMIAITRHPDGSPREQGTGQAAAKEYPPDHPAPGVQTVPGSVPL